MKREIAVAFVVALVGGFFFVQTWMIEPSGEALVGPGFVPTIIAVLIVGFAGLMAVFGLVTGGGADKGGEPRDLSRKVALRLVAIVALGYFYVFLFGAIGYVASTAIILALLLAAFGIGSARKIALFSLCGTTVYYVAFIKLLNIHSPAGWLIDFGALGLG